MTTTAELLDRTGLALLEAVLDSLGDDLPRLAYADWWEERGDAERANHIRDAIRRPGDRRAFHVSPITDWLARPLFGSARWVPADGGTPIGGFAACAETAVSRRGFVAEIALPLVAFLEHAGAVFASHPVERVTISDAVIHPSGGNDTYYVGGLGQFPKEYWGRLENLPTPASARDAILVACLAFGREAAKPIRAARLAAVAGLHVRAETTRPTPFGVGLVV